MRLKVGDKKGEIFFAKKMKIDWKKWLLIILGTISWSLTMVKSGWIYSYGMGFWGANGHDGIWHLALIESLSRGTLNMPVFAGSLLQNYHIGFDSIIALLHKLTGVPVINLYFQIAPPLIALAVGLLVHKFVENWQHSKVAAWWATFFVYFGGGFGYLFGKGESAFWSQQAVSSLINPPFALSLVFILLGLIFLQKSQKFHSTYYILLSTLFFGLLIEVKVYAGLLVLGGLLCASLFDNKVLKIFLGSLIISLLLFFSFNKGSESLLLFQPFYFLESMVAASDRFPWPKMAEAMMSYKTQHVVGKFIPAYGLVLIIFYLGNMGTRIVKEFLIWKWLKNVKGISWVEVFTSSIIVAGVVLPMLFLQKGTPWNTIQFFYYTLFFSAILSGVAVFEFVKNSKLSKTVLKGLGIATILLTIPTTIITLKDNYIPGRPPAMITNDELSALRFLSEQPVGVVLTYPYDDVASSAWTGGVPKPIYLYDTTAYVSAFSKKDVYLEDYGNLDITGYNWPERLREVESWYKEADQVKAREFLKDKNVKYVYWLKGQRAILGDKQLGLEKVYENNEVDVFMVKSN